MKKAALLILLPSFICAMQAPRGLTMDRATDCLKQGAQKAGKVAAHYVDQTVCCGCFENKMRDYLDDDHSIPNREKTACGCIGYNVGYSLNELEKRFAGELVAGGLLAEICVIHALTDTNNDNPHWTTVPRGIRLLNLLKANAPFAAFGAPLGLFHRRFNKVKAEFENEHDKNQ